MTSLKVKIIKINTQEQLVDMTNMQTLKNKEISEKLIRMAKYNHKLDELKIKRDNLEIETDKYDNDVEYYKKKHDKYAEKRFRLISEGAIYCRSLEKYYEKSENKK